MEPISLELKLISCRDLKAFNFFQKLVTHAAVSIFNEELNTEQQRQKSPVDREGGRNPEWNHQMEFNLKEAIPEDGQDRDHHISNLYLKFDIRRQGVKLFNYRTIGEVKVPLSDLVDGAGDFNGMVMRFVSYQVRTCDRKPNGVLNFCYKLKRKDKKEQVDLARPPPPNSPPPPYSPRERIDARSAKFVRYPSLEVGAARLPEVGRRAALYPSLDDMCLPLSGTRDVPSSPEIVPAPTLLIGQGASPYLHPTVQTPGRYCWCQRQTAIGNCYGFHGNLPAFC